jgi:hypothetical protein
VRRVRTILLALALLLGCAHEPLVVERVVVRDARAGHQVVHVLRDPASLARFAELWEARTLVDRQPIPIRDYGFSIEIATTQESDAAGRWMYREDGLTTFLTPMVGGKRDERSTSGKIYAIQYPAALNTLLGIAGDAASGDRAD